MFFKNLKWQLLASSIAAVILIACLIAFAANKLIIPAIIIAIIIAETGQPGVSAQTDLVRDLQLNSFDIVNIIAALEETFDADDLNQK